jgi:hypothetical protein
MHVYIFYDHCLQNHKMFIRHFLSTFIEILSKFSANQVQKLLLVVFRNLYKNQAESLVKCYDIYLVSVFQPMHRDGRFKRISFLN